MMTAPRLTTALLHLRPLEEADLASFCRYRQQPEVARFQSWSHYDLSQAQALLAAQRQVPFATPDSWYQLAITQPRSNALMGDLGLHFIDEQQLEIGFTLAPEYQGRGLAKAAVATLLDWYFGVVNGHRVTATCDVQNHASWRLLEALGFRREAHWQENIFFKGAWGSEYQYALLSREWALGKQEASQTPRQSLPAGQ